MRASALAVFNTIIWVVIPYFISSQLSRLPNTATSASPGIFSLGFVYAFGAIITGLQVLGALTEGMAISVPFLSGSHITSAYYIYSAVSGGTLALEAAGMKLTFSFQPLLFLFILPSMFNAIKEPIEFLLERSEVARSASDLV